MIIVAKKKNQISGLLGKDSKLSYYLPLHRLVDYRTSSNFGVLLHLEGRRASISFRWIPSIDHLLDHVRRWLVG